MKFSANISTMFLNMDLGERINEACASGFKAIEIQNPWDTELDILYTARNKHDTEVVMMNTHYQSYPVQMTGVCTFGMAAIPGLAGEFEQSMHNAVKWADFLKCKKLHVMAGIKPGETSFRDCEEQYMKNLQHASHVFQEYFTVALIEPICPEVLPNYFLNSFERAIEYITRLNESNVKLLLDIYHLYKLEGSIEPGLQRYLPYAGHIQVSQSPRRNDPFSEGDIDYNRVFQIIKESGYTGYIGLEYTPNDPVNPDFQWLNSYCES